MIRCLQTAGCNLCDGIFTDETIERLVPKLLHEVYVQAQQTQALNGVEGFMTCDNCRAPLVLDQHAGVSVHCRHCGTKLFTGLEQEIVHENDHTKACSDETLLLQGTTCGCCDDKDVSLDSLVQCTNWHSFCKTCLNSLVVNRVCGKQIF